MQVRMLLARIVASCFFLVCAGSVEATPVTYVFDGTGANGDLDGTPFSNVEFTVRLVSDTDDIDEFNPGWYDVHGPSTIEIEGIGSATFVQLHRVFATPEVSFVGFAEERPHPLALGLDLLDLEEPEFSDYQLGAPFGPVFEEDPMTWDQFVDQELDIGFLTITNLDTLTFEAIPVPEPTTLGLLCVGLLAVARRRR